MSLVQRAAVVVDPTVVRAVLVRHRDRALAELAYHRASGPRRGNVDATVASLKAAWLDAVLRDVDAVLRR